MSGGFRGFGHEEHEALRTDANGLLGPGRQTLREAENGRSVGCGEGVEVGEGGGDFAVTVLHVDYHKVVAG